jgi:hypothetical protein
MPVCEIMAGMGSTSTARRCGGRCLVSRGLLPGAVGMAGPSAPATSNAGDLSWLPCFCIADTGAATFTFVDTIEKLGTDISYGQMLGHMTQVPG